jgi:uncharacterized membrane protein
MKKLEIKKTTVREYRTPEQLEQEYKKEKKLKKEQERKRHEQNRARNQGKKE